MQLGNRPCGGGGGVQIECPGDRGKPRSPDADRRQPGIGPTWWLNSDVFPEAEAAIAIAIVHYQRRPPHRTERVFLLLFRGMGTGYGDGIGIGSIPYLIGFIIPHS